MIGSPFYYDVLFDDGPGDVVFHDCMWSGICTCCIQLLHQDSYQFANDSPDLKLENSHCRAQTISNSHNIAAANNHTITSTTTSASSLQSQLHQPHHQQPQLITNCRIAPESTAPISQTTGLNSNISSPDALAAAVVASANQCRTCPDDSSSSTSIAASAAAAAAAAAASRTASCLTSPDNLSSSSAFSSTSSSSSSSPAPAQHHGNTLSSLSPTCNSQSASPKPIRRREHNDSERKRRDHLRNAFNFLRDQVPRFKAVSKKPPRIQILHEATKYVVTVMKEAEELERRLMEERTKHELNMKLSMK